MTSALVATALFSGVQAFAATPKAKKKVVAPVKTKLNTRADSLSYAAGVYATNSLFDYLKGEFGLDETQMADFVRGFKDAIGKEKNKAYNAFNAGVNVYGKVQKMILPQTKGAFDGSADSLNTSAFYKGFEDGVLKDTTVYTTEVAGKMFNNFYKENVDKKNLVIKQENKKWLAENAKKEGVKTTPSGLQYKVITQGFGEVPTAEDEVTVKYVGRNIEGKEFDNSYKRNPQETTFRANQVIKGWTEALTMMPVGSKWELYIPSELAYGENSPTPAIKPNATLIFEVELVSVKKAQAEAPVEEVNAPADKTKKKDKKKK